MKKILLALVLVALVAGGAFLYDSWFGEPPMPSGGPITAAPIQTSPSPTPAAVASPAETATAQAPAVATTPSTPGEGTAAAPSAPRIFKIEPGNAEVSFQVYEELRGAPTNVIGRTTQVACQIQVDPLDLAKCALGEVRVNARTLATDNPMRNKAMQNRILETEANEFITFANARIDGLAGAPATGTTYNFKIAGDLTIHGITKPAIFDVALQIVSAAQLKIQAGTVVKRADYNLAIPQIPFVANVGEDVKLELNGTAVSAAGA